ncbi:MAG: Crp/Fnr family transcriptional regulator [Sphaerochaetaceae bacterium]|nr:Crp/Fnr family transcriptional regulator [Sphaerochaetaceae bacterium]
MQQIHELQPYYPMLCTSHLFSDIRQEDMDQLLYCLKGRKKDFSDEEFILHAEDEHDEFGLVLEGTVQLITEDMFGNRSITAKLKEGEIFGQIAASGQAPYSPTSVISDGPSAIMFLSFPLLVAPCTRACSFHSRIIENMMNVLAKRNLLMNQKVAILSQRTMREKLLAYLHVQSKEQARDDFTIPFNRDELADYLCVNRSALSREITKMVDDGLIETHRKRFILNETTFL